MRLNGEFLKKFKTEKIAVNCETKKEAKQFLKWCYNNKVKWIDDSFLIKNTHWEIYKNKTCYVCSYKFYGIIEESKNYLKNNNYTIVKFSDLAGEN